MCLASHEMKNEQLVHGSNSGTHCRISYLLTVIATLQLHYTTWQMCPNRDLTYVTNQTPCPNGLTHHSGPKSPLAVRICPFCPRPNGRNLTTSVRIWSLTLVPIFRGPDVALVIKDVAPISTAAKHDTKPCKACTSQSGVSSLGYVGCVTRSKDAYMML